MEALGKVVLFLLVSFVTVLITAFTVSTMWGWFIVPLGVKAIGFAHAYGLSLLVTFFTIRPSTNQDEDYNWIMTIALRILSCISVLLFGFIAVGFM